MIIDLLWKYGMRDINQYINFRKKKNNGIGHKMKQALPEMFPKNIALSWRNRFTCLEHLYRYFEDFFSKGGWVFQSVSDPSFSF